MEIIFKILTVFGLGAIELWVAIPTGFLLNLHPLVTGVTAAVGGMVGAYVVAYLSKRLRDWLLRRYEKKQREGKPSSLQRIWKKYGVVGFGLLAPLVIGAPIGVALGFIFGAPANRLLLWITFGIIFWSFILTVVGIWGIFALTG